MYCCSEVVVDFATYFEAKAVLDNATNIIHCISKISIELLSNHTFNGQPINTDNMQQNLSDQGIGRFDTVVFRRLF